MSSIPIKQKVDKFLELLPQLTKDEADLVEDAIRWDSETKIAFLLAKKIFEEDIESDSTELKQ